MVAFIFCFFVDFSSFTDSFCFQHSIHVISCLLIISQKMKSFQICVSSKYDEGSYNAQHPFSQLRIISIPRCMAKEAVISSSWQESKNSTIEHFIYSILFQNNYNLSFVLHFQKGYYKTQSEELMLHVLQAACKAHCFLKSYLSRKRTICKKSMLLLVSCKFYCIYGM